MVGVVLQCDACRMPLFRRYRVQRWEDDCIFFHPVADEIELPIEHFQHAHLPAGVALRFREALQCYSAGLVQAFAAMCRQTVQAMLEDLGERSRLRIFDQMADFRDLAQIDDADFTALRQVLFESDTHRGIVTPSLTGLQAAVLVELMKDLLSQTYVRKSKLQQALRRRGLPSEMAGAETSSPAARAARATPRSGRYSR